MDIATVLLPLVLVIYIIGVTTGLLDLRYRSAMARRTASAALVGAWMVHTAAVIQRGVDAGRLPLTNVAEYLLVLGWAVISLYLLVWLRTRMAAAVLVLPPVAALSAAGALALLQDPLNDVSVAPRGWFLFHTLAATLGMAILILALAMSLIYILQDRALKARRRLSLLDRLPSLDQCDQIGFHALLIGFILLSFGIATGVVMNAEIHTRLWTAGLKQTLPLLAWIVFAAVLAARSLGFRGRKAAYLTITGVALGLATAVGMTL